MLTDSAIRCRITWVSKDRSKIKVEWLESLRDLAQTVYNDTHGSELIRVLQLSHELADEDDSDDESEPAVQRRLEGSSATQIQTVWLEPVARVLSYWTFPPSSRNVL